MKRKSELAKDAELDHKEAAAYLGIAPNSLYNRNGSETGPKSTFVFGRRWYLVADLDEFLEKERQIQEPRR